MQKRTKSPTYMQLKNANETFFERLIIFFFVSIFSTTYSFSQDSIFRNKDVSHSFYITANTGPSEKTEVLEAIAKASQDDEEAGLLLLGNFTRRKGFSADEEIRKAEKEFLRQDLIQPLENFNGRLIFIPGFNEWNPSAPESIDDLESFLQDNSKIQFWPDDGCPIEREEINEDVVIVSVDSQWFLEDWDQHPEINTDCDYKTREAFFTEFKDDLKDSQGKTIIVAIHHPVLSGSRIPFFDRITGATRQSWNNQQYRNLRGRLETLASLFHDVIFVSGSHQNLQFLENARNPQIISGAAGDTDPAGLGKDGLFASEEKGFAKLTVFEDGNSAVQFFELTPQGPELVYTKKIKRERPLAEEISFEAPKDLDQTVEASIYTPEETQKSGLYTWLWGERYRDIYDEPIAAPVLYLDSLPGNLRPISEGGGQQSRSLRLINDNKNEYTLRAMRKAPLQYIQADLIKTSYIEDFLDNTIAESLISDYYTTAHPYAPFAVPELSSALNILHANPEIFYVPKQERLGIYNEDYGDALFMLEEHVGEENREFETFGSPDNILSTADLLLELRETKDSYVDQDLYIRARLFDMLIGDWDRHQDQWRWAQFEEDGKKRYEPIPRDRDHAFSKYDGPLIDAVKAYVPLLRKMQSYGPDIESEKWFNWSGYPLDQRFITSAEWQKWEEQAEYIQNNLTDEQIDAAFEGIPDEVKQSSGILNIKRSLKARRENLLDIAEDYYEYFQKNQVLTGTSEDDRFEITRMSGGITRVKIFREDEEIFSNEYSSEETEELWIYGLDGDDKFELKGSGDDFINLKILGGEENDIYDFANTKDAKIYDYKSAENTILNPDSKKWLVDSYEINRYDYLKRKYSENKIVPIANFAPDAGLTIGLRDVYTTYGLVRNPFTSQYEFAAQYYFASNGFALSTAAEYAHIFHNWNLRFEALYTSPNFMINYFGRGNGSYFDFGEVEKRYNRVKIQQWGFSPSIVQREGPKTIYFKAEIESREVGHDELSFVSDQFSPENPIFDEQFYAGTEAGFSYLNKDNPSYPSVGSEFNIAAGYKENIDEYDNRFGYAETDFSFDYPLIPSGFAVFATKVGAKTVIGDNYEFYHAATLGGNNSLRAYRNHRFNGQTSFFHSTDLRTALKLVRTNYVPFILGVTAGFDYGRVWSDYDISEEWHTSYGGSVWINGFYALTGNLGFYHGDDGNRMTFTINFKF